MKVITKRHIKKSSISPPANISSANKHKMWLVAGVLIAVIVIGILLYTVKKSGTVAGKAFSYSCASPSVCSLKTCDAGFTQDSSKTCQAGSVCCAPVASSACVKPNKCGTSLACVEFGGTADPSKTCLTAGDVCCVPPPPPCTGYCTSSNSCLAGSTPTTSSCPSGGISTTKCCEFNPLTPHQCVVSSGPILLYGGETINPPTNNLYTFVFDEVDNNMNRAATWSVLPGTSAPLVSSQQSGIIGKELGSFDGTTGLSVPSTVLSTILPMTSPSSNPTFSISLWFKTTQSGILFGQYGMTAQGPSGTFPQGWVPMLYVGTDGKLYGEASYAGTTAGGINQVVSTNTVTGGVYHHAVLTYGNKIETLYLDGKKVSSLSNLNVYSYADSYLYEIGNGYANIRSDGMGWPNTVVSEDSSQFSFTGQIDEFSVYDRAITLVDVNNIYQGGVKGLSQCGRACAAPGATEICDGIDNDCDTKIDITTSGASVCTQDISCGNSRTACATGTNCDSVTDSTTPSCRVRTCTPYSDGACVTPSLVSCIPPAGGTPVNAHYCDGDERGLDVNTPATLVPACTVAKCEYECDSGFHFGFGSSSCLTNDPPCSDGIRNQDETGVDCGGVCNGCGQPAVMKGNVYTAGNPQVINSFDLAMEALIVDANGDDDLGNDNTPPLQGSLYGTSVWVCDNGRYSLTAEGIVTCTAGFSEEANVYTAGTTQVINSFDLAMEALIVDANGDDDLGNHESAPFEGTVYGTSVWVCDDARYSLIDGDIANC